MPFRHGAVLPESALHFAVAPELTRLDLNSVMFEFMLAHLVCWVCDGRIVEEPWKRSDGTMTTTLTCLDGCGSRWWVEERTLAWPRRHERD